MKRIVTLALLSALILACAPLSDYGTEKRALLQYYGELKTSAMAFDTNWFRESYPEPNAVSQSNYLAFGNYLYTAKHATNYRYDISELISFSETEHGLEASVVYQDEGILYFWGFEHSEQSEWRIVHLAVRERIEPEELTPQPLSR